MVAAHCRWLRLPRQALPLSTSHTHIAELTAVSALRVPGASQGVASIIVYGHRFILVLLVVIVVGGGGAAVGVLPSSCPFFSLTDLPRWFHHNRWRANT